jgi:hypothetical protein
MTWQAPSARPYSEAPSVATFTDSRINSASGPTGGVTLFGNRGLLKRTGQRHTINIIQTTIDDFSAGNSTLSATALLVGGPGHINATSSFFVNNRGIGLRMFDGATGALNDCTISNNIKPIAGAAGISVNSGARASLTTCTIDNNTAVDFGGGVFITVGLHTRDKTATASACLTKCPCVISDM